MNMGIPKTIHDLKTWPEQYDNADSVPVRRVQIVATGR